MICLDFDGVLFDSAKEAFVIGCETFFGVDSNYDNSRVNYKRFLLLRPLVDSAWQYRTVFNILTDDLNDELMLIKGKQKLKSYPQKKDREFENIPDIDNNRKDYDIASWSLVPGDLIAFNFSTVHGAPGNKSLNRRRAFSARFTGDDATYAKRKGETSPPFPEVTLKHGEKMDSPTFPQIFFKL